MRYAILILFVVVINVISGCSTVDQKEVSDSSLTINDEIAVIDANKNTSKELDENTQENELHTVETHQNSTSNDTFTVIFYIIALFIFFYPI